MMNRIRTAIETKRAATQVQSSTCGARAPAATDLRRIHAQ